MQHTPRTPITSEPPQRRSLAGRAFAIVAAAAIVSSCQTPGDCGGDVCLVYTAVAGRVTAPSGNPVADLRLESQSATFVPGTGCDTTVMRTWYDVRTAATGRYVVTVPKGSFDEVNCAFVRLVSTPGLAWNDTLVGPLELGEFGTEPPTDTTQVDIVLQPAP
jgi:hypothetical protein